MSLHDEHLKQALKNAPDHDLAPNDATRSAILAYANIAVKPRQASLQKRVSNWMNEWFGSHWGSVGMGSAAATVLIVVVFWHQQPDDTAWQTEAPNNSVALNAKGNMTLENKSAEVASAKKANEDNSVVLERPSTPTSALPALKENQKYATDTSQDTIKRRKSDNKLSQAAVPLADQAESPAVAMSAPAPAAPTMQDKTMVLSAPAAISSSAEVAALAPKAELAKKSSLAVKQRGMQSNSGAQQSEWDDLLTLIKTEGGVVVANKDIQAGVLRLLVLNEQKNQGDVLAKCPLTIARPSTTDSLTGYTVETIVVCKSSPALQAEVESYNQTMRDWHVLHANK